MLVLGIETTCDETAAAVVRRGEDGRGEILSNIVLSQTDEHAPYGGVVPEIAARAHVEILDSIVARAMVEANASFAMLDGVAAAAGPGLIGGVIVGLTTAKAIALVAEKPLMAVNHLEAHALTARLTDGTDFPYCLFLASGGHTQIVAVLDVGKYVRLGTTQDDAIGEAFDKTAKLLGLAYPGGPEVEREAKNGDAQRFILPRPMLGRAEADFSLSGLKTALRVEAEKVAPLSDQDVADLCASFQQAVVDVVTDRLRAGLRLFREQFGGPTALVVAGGVAVNQSIRRALNRVAQNEGTVLVAPPPALCTDNGAMIAWAGCERLARGLTDTLDVAPRARWPLDPAAAGVTLMALERIAVVGAGAWGTALANCAARAGREVTLWARDPAAVADMVATRVSPRLPNVRLDERVAATGAIADLKHAQAVLLVVPAQDLRTAAAGLAKQIAKGIPVVACAKGIERGTHKFMTEVIAETLPGRDARDPVRSELRVATWRAACRPP